MVNGSDVGAHNAPPKTITIWDKAVDPTGAVVPFIKGIGISPPVANFIDDPAQGPISDCYFVAALSAYSWINFGLFAPAADIPFPGFIKMWANGVLPNNPYGIFISNELPLTSTPSSDTCGAPLTSPKNSACAGNESWVAFYEKAYAIFLGIQPSLKPSKALTPDPMHPTTTPIVQWGPYNPDITDNAFSAGNPLFALQTLTKLNFSFSTPPITAFYTQTWKMSNGCTFIGMNDPVNPTWGNFSGGFDGATGKTKFSTVAWTFFSATGNGGQDRPTPASPIQYNTDWLVANHAYTVLGKLNLQDPNTGIYEDYMILRNPFGPSLSGSPTLPVVNPSGKKTDAVYQNGFAWKWDISATTAPKKLNIGQQECNPSTNRSKPDGIFALRKQEFLQYFEVAGWVQ